MKLNRIGVAACLTGWVVCSSGCETTAPRRDAESASVTTIAKDGRTATPVARDTGRTAADRAYEAQDDAHALALYLPIAQAGDALVQARVAYLYKRNKGVPVNAVEACNWYEKAANGNLRDGASAVNVGVCFENAVGRQKSMQEAVRWYRMGAERNSAIGMYNLGLAFEYGQGVAQDYAQAAQWFQKALDAKLSPSDAVDAKRHLKRSQNHVGAARGDPQAHYDLFVDLLNGHAPEVQDHRRAMVALREAATKGNIPEAWYAYGSYLRVGFAGLPSDIPQGTLWIKKAADTGHEEARLRYANYLLCGTGVRKDAAAAERLLQEMIGGASWRAMSELSQWYTSGDCGFRKDETQSKAWRAKADAAQRAMVERRVAP